MGDRGGGQSALRRRGGGDATTKWLPRAPSKPRLEPEALRGELATRRRIAEGHFTGLRALEVEVEVMLPGEADAAVDLDRARGHEAVRVAGDRFRLRGRERGVGSGLGVGARGVVRRGFRFLDLDRHVGALVLDRLEAADRASELASHL